MNLQQAEKGFKRADELVGTQYIFGGGHKGFGPDPGLDCSGFASDVMHHMGILGSPFPLDVAALAHWGLEGEGRYFTLLTIVQPELEHCLLRFTLPDHPIKHLIAARHTGTEIEWYPMTIHIGAFITQGYQARRWAD